MGRRNQSNRQIIVRATRRIHGALRSANSVIARISGLVRIHRGIKRFPSSIYVPRSDLETPNRCKCTVIIIAVRAIIGIPQAFLFLSFAQSRLTATPKHQNENRPRAFMYQRDRRSWSNLVSVNEDEDKIYTVQSKIL